MTLCFTTTPPAHEEGGGIATALSERLRAATASRHAALERAAPMPACLTATSYASLLARHHAVIAPLESLLASIAGWRGAGIDLAALARLPALRADLAVLGIDAAGISDLAVALPRSFPAALGALYVLEGSRLGGKVILRAVEAQLGAPVAGAFFGGGGLPWWSFKAKLDDYGAAAPGAQMEVVGGALVAFEAFERAFSKEEALF